VTDAATLARLLRHESALCTKCVARKLALNLESVLDAVVELGKTVALDQGLSRCSVCNRRQWVLTLTKL
jgi:uncharacterized protein with PIN domain